LIKDADQGIKTGHIERAKSMWSFVGLAIASAASATDRERRSRFGDRSRARTQRSIAVPDVCAVLRVRHRGDQQLGQLYQAPVEGVDVLRQQRPPDSVLVRRALGTAASFFAWCCSSWHVIAPVAVVRISCIFLAAEIKGGKE
jgi:hypothetical protein